MTDGGRAMGDEELAERLRAAAHSADAVPAEVVAAAKACFTWRTIDAELAELSFDSYDDELVGVRGAGPTRSLTFERGDTVVELELEESTGGTRRLTGQVSPVPVAAIELHQVGRADPVALAADQYGRFRAENVAAGPFRLLCRFADAPVMFTDWVNA
jgi:hypothetical protein